MANFNTTSFKNLDSRFSLKMKKLNQDLICSLVTTIKSTPDACFVPTLNSYIGHVQNLLNNYRRPPPPGSISGIKQNTLLQKSFNNFTAKGNSSSSINFAAESNDAIVVSETTRSIFSPNASCGPVPLYSSPVITSTPQLQAPYSPITFPFTSPIPLSTVPAVSASSSSSSLSSEKAQSEPSTSSHQQENNEEETDEPPKNEFKPVVESDSLYSVRCKVYVKIGESFKDKGIGQLYVKKADTGKHQVVVRADNNLGTILLNLLLQKGLPLSKKSPKDVLTVDPTGGENETPVMVLIRVKSEETANELLDKLKEFANLSS